MNVVRRLQAERPTSHGCISGRGRDFSFSPKLSADSRAVPASYPVSSRDSFSGSATAGA